MKIFWIQDCEASTNASNDYSALNQYGYLRPI